MKIVRSIFALVIVSVAVGSCGDKDGASSKTMLQSSDHAAEIARMKAAVQAQLKDPDSAQFQEVVYREQMVFPSFEKEGAPVGIDYAVCGQVNARNGFGGYVGYRSFYAVGRNPRGKKGELFYDEGFQLASIYDPGNAAHCQMEWGFWKHHSMLCAAPGSAEIPRIVPSTFNCDHGHPELRKAGQ